MDGGSTKKLNPHLLKKEKKKATKKITQWHLVECYI